MNDIFIYFIFLYFNMHINGNSQNACWRLRHCLKCHLFLNEGGKKHVLMFFYGYMFLV